MIVYSIVAWLTALGRRVFPGLTWSMPVEDRVAYLTYDDGPDPDSTPDLLELLAEFDAAATFFLLGSSVEKYPDLVREILDRGHEVGSHSYEHLDPWKSLSKVALADTVRGDECVQPFLAEGPPMFRPPYGRFIGKIRRWASSNGRRMIMWSIMPGDFLSGAQPAVVARRVTDNIRPGAIIVLHDSRKYKDVMLEASRHILAELSHAGWRFAAIK